ncbi:endoribonuclease LACTB2, partial [Lecanoromycetidae sp. Uapishka_2]
MATQLPQLPEVERLSPLVIRSNTYLIGTGSSRLLIDTGEGKPSWSRLLSSVLSSESTTVSDALVTHWHHDHVGGIKALSSLCPSARIHKYNPVSGQSTIDDGQIFKTEGASLQAFHCPGHTTDHMAFVLEEEDAMFTGDNVLGHGTAVFEDLATYLDSLAQMRIRFNGRAYPGHGAVIEYGNAKISEYIEHRKRREEEILQALGQVEGDATPMELVKVVYKDVPEHLHEPAAKGTVQMLRKLEGEGRVAQSGQERWRMGGKATL